MLYMGYWVFVGGHNIGKTGLEISSFKLLSQKRYLATGGVEGFKLEIQWGRMWSPEMIILQGGGGVNIQNSYIRVCYTNTPLKAGYMALAPTLDLTMLYEVMWSYQHKTL